MSAIDRPGKRRKKKGKDDEKEGKGDFYSGIASTYTAPHRRFVVCHAPWRFPLCFLLCRNDPSYLKLCFFHRKETTASEGKDWRKSHPNSRKRKSRHVHGDARLTSFSLSSLVLTNCFLNRKISRCIENVKWCFLLILWPDEPSTKKTKTSTYFFESNGTRIKKIKKIWFF